MLSSLPLLQTTLRLSLLTISAMPDKISLQDGDVLLVMVRDGTVFHYSRNLSLPHVEFVRRKTGNGPQGAWAGTVSQIDGEIMGITSKYFYDYQLPAPPEVDKALQEFFGPSVQSNQAPTNTAGRRWPWLARLCSWLNMLPPGGNAV